LTGADGATFVLREGGNCYYAEENAISPLWKGQRFPLQACVSGWAMLHREPVVIEDIYQDARVPADAYRPTFVKSLVMVPIRTLQPVGAIGNYWARTHRATPEQVRLLSALADSTSIALENVHLYTTLERRVEERTSELAESRAELAAKNAALLRVQRYKDEMAALLVHDLKSPANGILMSCKARLRKPNLPEAERQYWSAVQLGAQTISRLANNLLDVSRGEAGALVPKLVSSDVRSLFEDVHQLMAPLAEGREQHLATAIEISPSDLQIDFELIRRVLQNLVDNALRYTPPGGTVRLEARDTTDDAVVLRVIDEGPGIPVEMRQRIFDRFTQLDNAAEGEAPVGHGLGLAFCRLAVEAHGGRIEVRENEPQGSIFEIRLQRGGPPQGSQTTVSASPGESRG
jgi:signal transduction histidine kinase